MNMWILSMDRYYGPVEINRLADSISTACVFQTEKRRMVGPFPPLPQEVSDVRSLQQLDVMSLARKTGISPRYFCRSEVPKRAFLLNRHYFLGRANTRADTAELLSVPPRTSGPSGVNTMPRESARTSKVSSAMVCHRLLCSS